MNEWITTSEIHGLTRSSAHPTAAIGLGSSCPPTAQDLYVLRRFSFAIANQSRHGGMSIWKWGRLATGSNLRPLITIQRDLGNIAAHEDLCIYVDDTLDASGGPVSLMSVRSLRDQGHIVGLNGNWAVVVQAVPLWHRIFSFIGPMEMSKDTFLTQLKTYIRADEYIWLATSKELAEHPMTRALPI